MGYNADVNRIQTCVEQIRSKTDFLPRAAVVLGSGLGEYAAQAAITHVVDYGELTGFPQSTVEGHAGRFLFGHVGSTPVVFMKGRVHFYEGYSMEDVTLPVRVMAALGAQTIILTNAAGGINPGYEPGDLMLIRDHISCFVPNPLIGQNDPKLGVRFPDMSAVYDPSLRERVKHKAQRCGISLREGVYVQLTGPSYETPAEIQMLRVLGADAVGMSTACEAIAARHMQMKVVGLSCITNMAAGITSNLLCHEEVQETADRVKEAFSGLLTMILQDL